MHFRRTIWLTLAALALLALRPARASAPIDLVVWHAYRAAEKAALEKVAAAFSASHPGLHVTTLAVPYESFADKITAAITRGQGPDVFIFAPDRLGGWIEAGHTVEPIGFFLDQATRDRFIPATLDAMTFRGTVYGLPVNYKVVTLIYNKKLIPRPPRDSTELVAMAKLNTDAAAGRFGLAYWYSDFYYHSALMNAFGGRVFEGATPVLDNPENARALEQLRRWISVDKILPAEPSSALVLALFNAGKAAMTFSGPWFIGEIAPGIDYGLSPLPLMVEAGNQPMRPWLTVEGAFVSAPSKHTDEAYEFVKYLTGREAGRIMALEGRQSPANKGVYEDPAVADDPVLKAFRAQVEVAVPMPKLPEMTMVWSPATAMMAAYAKGGIEARPALEKVQAQVMKDVAALRKQREPTR